MAARNGLNISSNPFEERYQPPAPKWRRRERLTAVDRMVCAVCGAFLGFVLWTFGYIIMLSGMMKAAARQGPAVNRPFDPLERLPPFWWGGSAALGFAAFGAVVGAERMMDGFDKVLEVEGKFARALNES